MKLLLDTHILLWAAGQPEQLPTKALKLLNDPHNELLFSPANLWEITIKRSLGRKDFQVDPRLLRGGLMDNGYSELMIASKHVMIINELPHLHKDPFDRILVAQAIAEDILLLTTDAIVAQYPGPIRKV